MANGSYIDNFASYEYADVGRYWLAVGPALSGLTDIQPKYARPPGGGALYIVGGAGAIAGLYRPMPVAAAATVVVHMAILFPSIPSGSQPFFYLMDGGAAGANEQVHLGITSVGKLTISRGSTVLATSTNALSPNVWYTLEAKITINNTTGAYEVRVDGTSVNWIPAATGANTRGSTPANNSADGYVFASNAVAFIYQLTDFLIANTAQSTITDFIGPGRLVAVYPSGAGTHADWTPNFGTNYACVSEKQGDGDNSFNQSSTPNQIDSFAMDDVPVGATVKLFQVNHLARKDAGAARTFATLVRAGGGAESLGTTFTLASSYLAYSDVFEVDPNTTVAWTAAGLNASEVGYKEIS